MSAEEIVSTIMARKVPKIELSEFLMEQTRGIVKTATEKVYERAKPMIEEYIPPSPIEFVRDSATSLFDFLDSILPPTPKEVMELPATVSRSIPSPSDMIKTLTEAVGVSPKARLDLIADLAAIATPPLLLIALIIMLLKP